MITKAYFKTHFNVLCCFIFGLFNQQVLAVIFLMLASASLYEYLDEERQKKLGKLK